MWYVYLLKNYRINRTYIGCTTDPQRRLRQHNGEIKGGAKSTSGGSGTWEFAKILAGFENRSSAMRWEKILKMRARGYKNRTAAFEMVGQGICPPSIRGKAYVVPKNITLEWV